MPVSAVISAPAKPPSKTRLRRSSSKMRVDGERVAADQLVRQLAWMMAIAWWPPWTHSPRPVIPASVSILTHRCMQWPLVAAVLTDVIFNWLPSEPTRTPSHCPFVVDRCDTLERGGPTVEIPVVPSRCTVQQIQRAPGL